MMTLLRAALATVVVLTACTQPATNPTLPERTGSLEQVQAEESLALRLCDDLANTPEEDRPDVLAEGETTAEGEGLSWLNVTGHLGVNCGGLYYPATEEVLDPYWVDED